MNNYDDTIQDGRRTTVPTDELNRMQEENRKTREAMDILSNFTDHTHIPETVSEYTKLETGFIVRVLTQPGKWESKDILDLTDSQMEQFILRMRLHQPIQDGWEMVKVLVKWIKESVESNRNDK
jgi:hypothetical protein